MRSVELLHILNGFRMNDVPLTYEQMDTAMRKVGEQKKRIEQLEAALTNIRELPMHDYCTTLAGYAGAVRAFAKEALGAAGV